MQGKKTMTKKTSPATEQKNKSKKTMNNSHGNTCSKEDRPLAFYKNAVDEIDFSDLESAIEKIDNLISESPKNSYLYAQRGGVNFHRKKYFSAINDLTKALIYGGNKIRVNVLMHRAMAKEMRGDVLGALGDYLVLRKICPNEEVLVNAALISDYLGRTDWAETYYREALQINPQNQMAIYGLQLHTDPDHESDTKNQKN